MIFGNHDRDHVVDIKAINPQLLALNPTNACELAFDPSPNPPAWANVEVRVNVRTVTENSRTLKFTSQGFERE